MRTYKQFISESKPAKVNPLDLRVKALKAIIAQSGKLDAVKAWIKFEEHNPKDEFYSKLHLKKASIIIKQHGIKTEK